MTDLPTYAELKADAMDRFVARLVKHGISEAEARCQEARRLWRSSSAA